MWSGLTMWFAMRAHTRVGDRKAVSPPTHCMALHCHCQWHEMHEMKVRFHSRCKGGFRPFGFPSQVFGVGRGTWKLGTGTILLAARAAVATQWFAGANKFELQCSDSAVALAVQRGAVHWKVSRPSYHQFASTPPEALCHQHTTPKSRGLTGGALEAPP